MTHSQDTTPTNPAQVTDARYDNVALETAREIVKLVQRCGDDHLKAKIQVKIIEALTAAIGAGSAEKLGRFDHHPDPAIDFEIEVESLQARLIDAKARISKPGTEPEKVSAVLEDIQRAMTFRVGGDQSAVRAKQILREIEADAISAIGAGNETPAGKWAIDRSTDSPILTYENCSVIQDEQAFYVLGLIRDAIGAGGQAVAVKPLEWFKPDQRNTLSRAETDFGVYRTWTHFEANGRWFWSLDGYEKASGECASEDDAKAAAQADFERRALSAIAHPVQPGWREDKKMPQPKGD